MLTCLAGLPRLDAPALGQADAPPVDLKRAEALARQHCATCHLFPEPALLDKDLEQPGDAAHGNPAWPLAGKHQPPPRSRGTLEKRQVSQETHNPGGRLPSDRRILSGQGTDQPVAQKPLAPIGLELPQFTAKPSRFRRTVGAVNMVRIDEQRRQIFHSDGLNHLDVLDANGNLVESLKVGNVPVGFEENGGSFF